MAGVLVWAAVAKLRDRRGVVVAFRRLRLPSPELLSVVVPVWELAVAVTLLARPSVGAVAAAGTFGLFAVLIPSWSDEDGRFRCPCFGAAGSEMASRAAVARNVVLLGLSVMAAGTRRLVVPTAADAALFVALGVSALAVWRVLAGGQRSVPGRRSDSRSGSPL